MIGYYSYTVILTYLSLLISLVGIILSLGGHFYTAITCLLLSGLCDMLDGKVARTKKNRTEEEKRFGIQIDSLCDLVCFGVFPVVIGYSLGVRSHYGVAYMGLYLLAAVIRLAYFNVSEETRQQETDENRKYYQGLPVTSVSIIIPIIFLLKHFFARKFIVLYEIALIAIAFLFVLDIKIKKPDRKMTIILGVVVSLIVGRLIYLGVYIR